MHNLEFDMQCEQVKKLNYMSIDMLEIEMTHMTRQLIKWKLQLKYLDITLFKYVTVFSEIDSSPQNILHIHSK